MNDYTHLPIYGAFEPNTNASETEKQRLNLKDVKGESFTVAAFKTISNDKHPIKYGILQKINHFFNYVKIYVRTGDNSPQEVLVNINSLSKRLLLPKNEIRKAYAGGNLEELIEERRYLLKFYTKVLDKYEERQGKMFLKGPERTATGLTRATLEKVLWQVATTDFSILATQEMTIVDETGQKHTFLALVEKRNDKHKVHILQLQSKATLGEGTFGIVSKVWSLASGKFAVMKEPATGYGVAETARRDIRKEYENLVRLHDGKPDDVIGLQGRPRGFIEITGEGFNEEQMGILGEKVYPHGDASQACLDDEGVIAKLTPKEQKVVFINAARDLSKTLAYFAQKRFFHGDIKPKNIFVDISKDGKFIFKLGDVGGGNFYNSYGPLQRMTPAHTSDFFPEGDAEAIESAMLNNERKIFEALHYQNDTAALGITLYLLMMRQSPPFPIGNVGLPIITEKSLKIAMQNLSKEYPVEVCDLMQKMLDPDPSKRISPKECAEAWNDIANSISLNAETS